MARLYDDQLHSSYDWIHFNKAGFPAFKREGIERLREILYLGITGNTYYVDKTVNIREKLIDLSELINEINPEIVAKLIVDARNNGFFRHLPIMALTLLRKKSIEHFQQIFDQVIITGQDLEDFLTISKTLGFGFGRAVKRAIHSWLEKKVNSFYAIKYRKSIADAIALTRPDINTFKNSTLLKYCYGAKKRKIMKELEITDEKLIACEKFKKLTNDNKIEEAIAIAEKAYLPSDIMISLIGNIKDPKIWYIIAKNMGVMQFLKYLNKLSSILDKEMLLHLCEQKLQLHHIIKAKIFPYSIFIAWYYSKNKAVKEFLRNLLEIYPIHYDFGVWKQYSFAIAPDISGSMTSSRSKIKPSAIAGFFSAVLGKALNLKKIYMWNTQCYITNIENMQIVDIFNIIYRTCGGGTNMSTPIETLIKSKEKVDIVLIITDSQHWYSPSIEDYFTYRWIEYKKKINPSAKAVIIEVVGYGDSPVPADFAERFDVYTVFGWSESVFRWIEMKILNKMM